MAKTSVFEKIGKKKGILFMVLVLISEFMTGQDKDFIQSVPSAPVLDMKLKPKDAEINTEHFMQRCRIGIMGIFGGNARRVGFSGAFPALFDEEKNIEVAAVYLKYLFSKFSLHQAISLYVDGVTRPTTDKRRLKLIADLEKLFAEEKTKAEEAARKEAEAKKLKAEKEAKKQAAKDKAAKDKAAKEKAAKEKAEKEAKKKAEAEKTEAENADKKEENKQ